jgi:hypothetical protein
MSWKKIDNKKIIHGDGHIIELLEGTWTVPLNITPYFSGNLHPLIAAQVLRQGLSFAAMEFSEKKPLLDHGYCKKKTNKTSNVISWLMNWKKSYFLNTHDGSL